MLEDITAGDAFYFNKECYIATCDFKTGKVNDLKKCISLKNGFSKWIDISTLIEIVPLYTIDTEGNIVPIKETKKPDENPQ